MTINLHVLANPFGITNPRYRMEPFNVAVGKFISNMSKYDYNIIHYGHESSEVGCEHITVITNDELHPPDDHGLLIEQKQEYVTIFGERTNAHLKKVKQEKDLVLCFYGNSHIPAVKDHPDLTIVEPSIGYLLECVFAPYRAFTSYSQMHYFYGYHKQMLSPSWFDEVIPNAFTPEEFEFCSDKDDYYVYLGRIQPDKGINLCIQLTERLQSKLIIAGPGDLLALGYKQVPKHVIPIGYVNPQQRKNILKRARALLAPTHYLEPFGNMTVEAHFCGTPVISTDWGGFVDTIIQGVNGYRCKDFKSFLEAAQNVDKIKPEDCYQTAISRYSDQIVHAKFDQWLQKIYRNDFYYV